MENMLIKQAVAEFRACQEDRSETLRCMLSFIRRGMGSGHTLEEMILTLALGPGSVLRRVPYSESQIAQLIDYLKHRTVSEILCGGGSEEESKKEK
jgi:hypothetical protein